MPTAHCYSLFGPLAGLVFCGFVLGAPRVEFELVTETGFPIDGAQRWIEVMKDLDHSGLRIRSAGTGDKQTVANRGSEASPSYHVVGILTRGNRLRLPGGEFSLGDRERIAKWIKKLQEEGIEGLTAQTLAFGLTSEQLVQVHDRLAKVLGFETKGRRAGDVTRQIVQDLAIDFQVTAKASEAFGRNEAVEDELHGLSSGTALAAVLRPLGLVVAPEKAKGGKVRLLIADVREVDESWPVGWPSQDSPYKVAPKLFEYLNVEIQDTSLAEALSAIGQRIETPLLLDHNSMARHRIEPREVKVSFPKGKTFYLRIIENLLFQAKLKSELRLDEAGKPFLWVFSTKQ